MTPYVPFIGIIACSGEELPEGTTSRVACRKVIEELRPAGTVVMCLPLFVAGEVQERSFAKKFPTIAVDGCEKKCAARATESLSGKPVKCLVVPEILERKGIPRPTRLRHLGKEDQAAASAVAEEIVQAMDEIRGKTKE